MSKGMYAGIIVPKGVAMLLVALVLLTVLNAATVVNSQETLSNGIVRHSPDIITKILTSNLSLQQLSKLLNSTNVDTLLGDEGLEGGILNITNVVNSLTGNPEAAAQLMENDVAKLSTLTTQSTGSMPSDLRIDLSLLASLAKDSALQEILKGWALTGNVDLQELKNKVNINSLSPEDLAILKSALGLAIKYRLANPDEINGLGLGSITSEDLKAIASISKKLAGLSKDPRATELLRELARKSTELTLSGNLTPGSLTELMAGSKSNASLPYVVKSITSGLRELAQASGSGATPTIPGAPKLNLPLLNIQSRMPSANVSAADILSFLRITLASVVGILLLYMLFRLLRERMQYVILSMRKGKAVPQVESVSGINASIIRAYWDAVTLLSAVIPLEPSETHREYLHKARSVAGTAFEQLTRIYELARWSGQKLDEGYAVTASKLAEAVKNMIRKGLGGGSG